LFGRRLSFLVTDCTTGTQRTFTLRLWSALGGACFVLLVPVLVAVGSRWAVRSELRELTGTAMALRMENDSYRDATGQLASQIAALQGAVDAIGSKAAVDPAVSRAMEKLPANVKSRAMGGATGVTAAMSVPDSAFSVLRDLLGGIEDRLALVRSGVERRQALALATPSIWPVTGWLSSPYGGRRDPFTGQDDFHPGLDISAPQGEAVLSPADAIVSAAGPGGDYGNLVVLDHGYGIVTKYGHLSRFAVSAGQAIKRGDVIAYVGTTGRSTSPHLHYEIWINGRLTNPMRLLAQR
jgi:murein DD-endopeptidase MepM/ murein hydrolase activator NlpD